MYARRSAYVHTSGASSRPCNAESSRPIHPAARDPARPHDTKDSDHALIAGLENGDGFRPWLSDDASWPDMAFVHGKGRYTTVDRVVIADDWQDLTDGVLDAAIALDENGALLELEAVFTNTTSDGTPISTEDHCEGWTSVFDPNVTRAGWSTEIDATAPCDTNARLYCFEQD